MKMLEAYEKVKILAHKRSFTVEYRLYSWTDKSERCCVYIEKVGHFTASNWEGAIDKLEAEMRIVDKSLPPSPPPDMEVATNGQP